MKSIRKSRPQLKVLVLTNFNEAWFVKRCVDARIDAVISKSVGKNQLAHLIDKVYSGEMNFFFKKFP